MIRILALLGYVFQSLVAVALIFVVSRWLSAVNFTSFSLAQAASQLVAIFGFEWLQLAGVRFLASETGRSAERVRSSLVSAAVISSAVILVVALGFALVARVSLTYIGLGAALAIAQGFVDLYFMMFRVAGKLGAAATMMVLRSCALFLGAAIGAYGFDSAAASISGILAGQLSGIVMAVIVDRSMLAWRPLQWVPTDIANFCRYGMLAAGASVIHLSVPMTIRLVSLSSMPDATARAGLSLALDLLQRPFNVLIAAIHTVAYPRVVMEFDRGSLVRARRYTSQLFELTYSATLAMFAGLIAFLPECAHWILMPALADSVLVVAPAATLFYFLHTHLQATMAVVLHLQKSVVRLCVVAGSQAILVAVLLLTGKLMRFSPPQQLFVSAVCTFVILLAAIGPTRRFGAYPRLTVVFAASAAAVAVSASVMLTDYTLKQLLIKGLIALVAGIWVLLSVVR